MMTSALAPTPPDFTAASSRQPSWARAHSAVESMGLSEQLNKQDLDAIVAICPLSFTIHVHHRCGACALEAVCLVGRR